MLKNKILSILLFMALCAPAIAQEPADSFTAPEPVVSQEQEAETFDDIKANSALLNNQQQELDEDKITYKQPVSKRKIAKKFLLAMAGVAISSIILFVLLTIYNKIRESFAGPPQIDTGKEPSLETPDNLVDAVKTFLDKTKWDN